MLRTNNFEVDDSAGCKLDNVVIYEGTAQHGKFIKELCGSQNFSILSTNNVLTVVFSTSEVVEYRGFLFEYYSGKY